MATIMYPLFHDVSCFIIIQIEFDSTIELTTRAYIALSKLMTVIPAQPVNIIADISF